VKRIVIAGGIGAGKTAVTERLRALGFGVVDADVVAHHITERGLPALQALNDAFGDAIFGEDGSLDRAFMADVVFHDATALRRLNNITHGHIGMEILDQLKNVDGDAAFIALPLFSPEHRVAFSIDQVWAVQVKPDTALDRLVRLRGFSEEDAKARLANQMSNDERAKIVDRVIWNEDGMEDLYRDLDAALDASGLRHG
jgi:dephospho-CoA kinase